MTTVRRNIENLEPRAWAALIRRTARYAVAAAQDLGERPPLQLLAAAGATEAELVEHRQRSGDTGPRRPTAQMRIAAAEHQRVLAEHRAADADQNREDALADAVLARAEADSAAKAAESARQQARSAEVKGSETEARRVAEQREAQDTIERLTKELAELHADSESRLAALEGRARAAEERAEQRAAERVSERTAGQRAVDELQAQLERVRADADAAIAAAVERARAAQERAEQRIAERSADRVAGQRTIDELQTQLERVRADADAAIAMAREQTRAARAQAQELMEQGLVAKRMLTLPIPNPELRLGTRRIEKMLAAMRQMDYAIEMANLGEADDGPSVDDLSGAIREHAGGFVDELHRLPARFGTKDASREASVYVRAAATTCSALLQRISLGAQRLQALPSGPPDDVLAVVIALLTDVQVQRMFEQLAVHFPTGAQPR